MKRRLQNILLTLQTLRDVVRYSGANVGELIILQKADYDNQERAAYEDGFGFANTVALEEAAKKRTGTTCHWSEEYTPEEIWNMAQDSMAEAILGLKE